jgi:hypothetical protein
VVNRALNSTVRSELRGFLVQASRGEVDQRGRTTSFQAIADKPNYRQYGSTANGTQPTNSAAPLRQN